MHRVWYSLGYNVNGLFKLIYPSLYLLYPHIFSLQSHGADLPSVFHNICDPDRFVLKEICNDILYTVLYYLYIQGVNYEWNIFIYL